jgi:hypothetical protein
MRNFSETEPLFASTGRDETISSVIGITGLPKETVAKLYESMKADNLSDSAVVEHFEKISTPKNAITCKAFFGSLVDGLSGIEGSMSDVQKTGVTNGILQALDDFSGGIDNNTMEPAELLAVVKGIVEMKNPKAKDLLSKDSGDAMVIAPVVHDYSRLNEAMETGDDDTVQLYEGLRRILGKNTRRWGNAYRLENSYNTIMEFIDSETQRIQLENSIVSIDDGFHIELVNDLLSGNVNPIYKHINGVRQFIPDTQTLVFDMVVLVNCFMRDNQFAMEYLSRQNVNEYNVAAKTLLASISSSRKSSKILLEKLRKATPKPMPDSDGDGPLPYNQAFFDNFLNDCSNGIDPNRLKYSTWNLPLKAVVDMLNLVKSMSGEFNLAIRPLIRNYVTKAYGITGRIEKAKREVKMFGV